MRNRQIPRGLRDLMPDEVKVIRTMEKKATGLFNSYGYEEVMTPTFEFLEVVEAAMGRKREELFLFMDREGGILSLRPEVTGSIARMAAIHMESTDFPRRLFYMANVFRQAQPHLARYREFWQMGIELLGTEGIWADAEVINIAVKLLRQLGLEKFKISINQIGIFNSLLDESGMSSEDREILRNLVEGKDMVELSRHLERLSIDDELKHAIALLPVLHGGLEIIDKIPYLEKNRRASAAVEELLQLYEALRIYGVADDIVLDMGVLRKMDYYTGVVFEGYSPELGYGLLGGGRYDHLIEQFGLDCPATGFTLNMDRLAMVLTCRDKEPDHYLLGGKDPARVVSKAEEMRRQGKIVETDPGLHSREELEERIKAREGWNLEYIDD